MATGSAVSPTALRLPIRGRRVVIRRPEERDLGAWYELEADPSVKQYVGGPVSRPKDEWIAGMREGLSNQSHLVVEDRGSGSLACRARLDTIDLHLEVVIGGAYWGAGYGREVCRLLIDAAFDRMGARELFAVVDPDNKASRRLVAALGFVKIGTKSSSGWDDGHLIFRRRNPPQGAARWGRSILSVGYGRASGRGFVIATERGERLVITAAHCLPRLPPAQGLSYVHERTYADILGPLGDARTVWAECLFVEPVADLAVLGSPDDQMLSDEAEAYERLVEAAVPLKVGDLPLTRSLIAGGPITPLVDGKRQTIQIDPMLGPRRWEGSGWLLALRGRWFRCDVKAASRALSTCNLEQQIAGGMSGSPIISDDGYAVGVVTLSGGPHPFLARSLPGWVLDELAIRRRR
jgi:RimJ/RimL family protein N-acetyltransferase